jgi:hypothetical protein
LMREGRNAPLFRVIPLPETPAKPLETACLAPSVALR